MLAFFEKSDIMIAKPKMNLHNIERRRVEITTNFMEHKKEDTALIIAHRGAKSLAKVENTIESFQLAINMNFKMIEFDVRRTKDHQFIIFHNKDINGKAINSLTYQELLSFTKTEGYQVPLLKDVLKICYNKIMLDIELKEKGYELEVIDLIEKNYHTSHFIITSFYDTVIQNIKEHYPHIKAGLLLGMENASLKQRISEFFPFYRLKSSKADFVVPNYHLVTPWFLKKCRQYQYKVYVWTVNADSIYSKLIRHRVSGIITDYPQRYTGNYIY